MGHYDITGYNGLDYSNLVPGGTAELSSFGGSTSPLANAAIASSGHTADFYTGYGNSGDDPLASGRTIPDDFNCLADFMGTSQDSCGNVDGGTTFYHFIDGSKLYAEDAVGYGIDGNSGMYGILEYVEYAGYGIPDYGIFNQYIDAQGLTYGFTFAEYMAEIDAGRPVMIHVVDHSMFGYGYDAATTEVILHDTWNGSEHRMTWGGSYSGLDHLGVTVMELTGGDFVVIPEPASLAVWSLLCMVGFSYSRRRKGRAA